MDREGIVNILEGIGAKNIREYSRNIQCSCFLADWREGHTVGSDHAGSMGISIDVNGKSWVNCFSCQFKGTLVSALITLSKYSGRDYSRLINFANDKEELNLEYSLNSVPKYDKKSNGDKSRRSGVSKSVFRMLGFKPGAHEFIINRGFPIEILREWGTWYDFRYKRVVFPVYSCEGISSNCGTTIVGASGRTVIKNTMPVYYNYFNFDKSRYLFGEQHSFRADCGIIVEGILDTISVYKVLKEKGFEDRYCVVGIMGSNASEKQIKKIIKWFSEVILFLDNDPAGWTGFRKLANRLRKLVLLRGIKYPKVGGCDPDELIQSGIDVIKLIENADLVII